MPSSVAHSQIFANASGGTNTDSVTLPASANSTLVVAVGGLNSGTRDVTSVTYDGVAMTRRSDAFSFDDLMVVFTLENPPSGAKDLVTTMNESTVNFSRFVALVDGGGGFSASAIAIADTVNVASATGGLVIGVSINRNATAFSVGAGQTQLQIDVTTGNVIRGILSSEAGAGTVTSSFTATGGDQQITAGVAIAPASGGGSSIAAISSGPNFLINPRINGGLIR